MVSRRSSFLVLAPLAALLAVLVDPAPAAACGGMVFPDHELRPGGMSDQEIAVVWLPEETVLVASAGYKGAEAAEFAFILPLASVPADVRDADPALFLALDEYSAPRIRVLVDDEQPSLCGGGVRNAAGGDFGGGPGEVMVHQRGQTATYEWVVVGGDTGTAVADWLDSAGFALPDDYAAALTPYVDGGSFFFAARVKADADAGALAPIELHLPPSRPDTFRIPLAIAAHSLAPGEPLGVTAYFLAGGPVLTANYLSEAVDPDELLARSDSETNYGDLERAILDTEGGAWIIDYNNPLVVADLALAYELGVEAGRIDPADSDIGFLDDFAERLGLDQIHLTRLRTELLKDQLRDLELRPANGPPVLNSYDVVYDDRPAAAGCVVDRTGRLPQLLLLVPVLAWIRRRPRR
ncbi:MAG TPA: DUF2330 domain-containing protein [Nannocystis sp.]